MGIPPAPVFGGILQKRSGQIAILLLSAAAVVLVEVWFYKIGADPKVSLLISEESAEWLRFPDSIDLRMKLREKRITIFRKRFKVDAAPGNAKLTVKAFRSAEVKLDGQVIMPPHLYFDDWKIPMIVDVGRLLRPGDHEIIIGALNENGHPAVLAYSKEIKLFTGRDWEASEDGGKTFVPALPVDDNRQPDISRNFPRADKALLGRLPFLLPPAFLVFAITIWWYRAKERPVLIERIIPTPGRIRWVLMGALAILGINDMLKLPLNLGYDMRHHLQYIKYIAENWRIPLATEGWMMFHPPLFYLICTPIYIVFTKLYGTAVTSHVLRLIPVACSVLQVEFTYRILKSVYPDRKDMQVIGTVIGGLLPLSIYMSQTVQNEPLSGCLTSAVLVMAFSLFRNVESAPRQKWHLPVMGLLLGLALLTKTSAILLLPALLILLLFLFYGREPVRRTISRIAIVFGVAFVISGWYYIRNIIVFHDTNIGNWDPNIYKQWWQEPGYRTIGQYVYFGKSLFWPIYSGVYRAWDAIYSTLWLDGILTGIVKFEARPPWNYNFLLSGAWLALLPAVAILLGIIKAIWQYRRSAWDGRLFAVLLIVIYYAGFLHHYLMFPMYAAGKASYMLGLLSCYAVLAVSGLDSIIRRPFVRAAVYAGLTCWAIAAYCAYFVV